MDAVLGAQRGIITRAQALRAGMTDDAVRWRVRLGGPWRIILPGVYATFTGTLTELQRWQAALLYGGHGAALTGLPALRLARVARLACEGRSPS